MIHCSCWVTRWSLQYTPFVVQQSYGSFSHWSTCAMSSLWLTSCEIANIMPLTYRSAFQISAFAEVHFSKTPNSTVLIKCTWTATMHLINAFCLFRSIRRASLYLKNTERKQCCSSLFIMWCYTCESVFLLRLDGALDRYIMTDLLHRFSACVCLCKKSCIAPKAIFT